MQTEVDEISNENQISSANNEIPLCPGCYTPSDLLLANGVLHLLCNQDSASLPVGLIVYIKPLKDGPVLTATYTGSESRPFEIRSQKCLKFATLVTNGKRLNIESNNIIIKLLLFNINIIYKTKYILILSFKPLVSSVIMITFGLKIIDQILSKIII